MLALQRSFSGLTLSRSASVTVTVTVSVRARSVCLPFCLSVCQMVTHGPSPEAMSQSGGRMSNTARTRRRKQSRERERCRAQQETEARSAKCCALCSSMAVDAVSFHDIPRSYRAHDGTGGCVMGRGPAAGRAGPEGRDLGVLLWAEKLHWRPAGPAPVHSSCFLSGPVTGRSRLPPL
jgi:hypothetical protein